MTDRIAHLTFFDLSAARAINSPADSARDVEMLWAAVPEGDGAVDNHTQGPLRDKPPEEFLED